MVDADFNIPPALCYCDLNITWENYQVNHTLLFNCVTCLTSPLELGFGKANTELHEISSTKCCIRYLCMCVHTCMFVVRMWCSHVLQLLVSIGEGGMLIHCVSGWDRTPLFVSLLRLSLWAVSYYTISNSTNACVQDGKIHKSLCAAEILYFTIAYDWLLFG